MLHQILFSATYNLSLQKIVVDAICCCQSTTRTCWSILVSNLVPRQSVEAALAMVPGTGLTCTHHDFISQDCMTVCTKRTTTLSSLQSSLSLCDNWRKDTVPPNTRHLDSLTFIYFDQVLVITAMYIGVNIPCTVFVFIRMIPKQLDFDWLAKCR